MTYYDAPGSSYGQSTMAQLPQIAPMSVYLKENLRRLKNLLKLPKARRWVLCEFFYSELDRELFLGENDFEQCLRDSFPNLKTRQMNKQHWRKIRALIGRPRRCSQAFFDEELAALQLRRQRLRDLYNGQIWTLDPEVMSDLPQRVPRPLAVGTRVYVRLREPRDGVFVASVEALMNAQLRVVFEKDDVLPPANVPDTEVMRECEEDLVPVSYFIEKNRALFPTGAVKNVPSGVTLALGARQTRSTLMKYDPILSTLTQMRQLSTNCPYESPVAAARAAASASVAGRDEKVGNYPVRLLVMMEKARKLTEQKAELVRQVGVINDACHKMSVFTNQYPQQLQVRFAELLLDLEEVNNLLEMYLKGIAAYHSILLPHLTSVPVTSRPESMRRLCHSHATQIVKYCNNGLNVRSERALALITSLTALLLQIRALGSGECAPHELQSLTSALNDIRHSLKTRNVAAFQDHVEVHMKEIHQTMLRAATRMTR